LRILPSRLLGSPTTNIPGTSQRGAGNGGSRAALTRHHTLCGRVLNVTFGLYTAVLTSCRSGKCRVLRQTIQPPQCNERASHVQQWHARHAHKYRATLTLVRSNCTTFAFHQLW
jgi:hypothetical protein